jgi:hypothetical protein
MRLHRLREQVASLVKLGAHERLTHPLTQVVLTSLRALTY